MVGRRSYCALSAAAPRARDHQCRLLRAVGRSDMPDASAIRCRHSLGTYRPWSPDPFHGSADHLCTADRSLGGDIFRASQRNKQGRCEIAIDGVGFGRLTYFDIAALAGNHRTYSAGTIWHDRDWHGTIQLLPRRSISRMRRQAATWRRSPTRQRRWRASRAERGR